jgi:bifunctional DNA-binding transcriptional regulator/antitoxin component of YhaV-PrlF toxin-antitoxin module
MAMKRLKISRGGQVAVPAEVRHRWKTNTLLFEDHGDSIVLRPVPDDPIAAARGALAHLNLDTAEMRRRAREDERIAEERRR